MAQPDRQAQAPWHFLYFLPLPHQQGSLRPIFSLLGDDALLRDRGDRAAAVAAEVAGHRGGRDAAGLERAHARGGDRLRAGELLVLVDIGPPPLRVALELIRPARVELRVEERCTTSSWMR